MAQAVKNLLAMQETWFNSWVMKISSPGGGNDNPLQYSCLENPMDREAWWVTVCGVAESGTTQRLSTLARTISVTCFNHPKAIPTHSVRGKIVFHETSPWCQKGC